MSTPELVQRAVGAYFAANDALDVDAIAALLAPDARMERVPGTPPIAGREAIRHAYAQFLAPFARARWEITRTHVAGNGAAVAYRGTLTARNGRSVTVEGIDTFAIDPEGRIAAICFYWDPTALMALLRGGGG
jgi:steroid delta-isomerase